MEQTRKLRAWKLHGAVPYYDMGQLDLFLEHRMQPDEFEQRKSPSFNTNHKFFWVNEKTEIVESFQSLYDMEKAYNEMYAPKPTHPIAFEYRGVRYYGMKELDYITNLMTPTELIDRLSRRFSTAHRYWWIHPGTGAVESIPSREMVEQFYKHAAEYYSTWDYADVKRPVLTPFDVH